MTEPTDDEIAALRSEFGITSNGRGIKEYTKVRDFARAVLAKWGTPPAVAGEPVAWLSTDSIGERYLCFTKPNDSDPVRPLVFGDTTPQPTQAQAGSVTADDLKQPRNGAQWRVEWWNESCRMLLPANKRLDSFQTYRNGTLMFTIKEKSGIKGGQHGADT